MLPTLKEAQYIVKKYPSMFKEKVEFYFGDFPFVNYNYVYTDYNIFKECPLARELRGITYNKVTGECFPSLHKFFNFNECELSPTFNPEEKLVVYEKIDGSLIIPIVNEQINEVLLKTKSTAFNEHSKIANKFLQENDNYKYFILECYVNGIQPIFELVSPKTTIVIEYENEDLYLLALRNKKDGSYFDFNQLKYYANLYNIKTPSLYKFRYNQIEEILNTKEGIEGYVYQSITPSKFVKFKTKWYFNKHKYCSPNNLKLDDILKWIVNQEIDDVLSCLNREKKKEVVEIVNAINLFKSKMLEFVNKLENQNKSRKEIAICYLNHYLFGLIMSMFQKSKEDKLKAIDVFILNNSQSLKKSTIFVKKLFKHLLNKDLEFKTIKIFGGK